MLSMRGRLTRFMLQHRHWMEGHLRKPVVDWTRQEAILDFRRQVEEGSTRFGRLPRGMQVEPVEIPGVPAEWLRPESAVGQGVMLYFHGGGYVTGTCESHRPVVGKFVEACGLPALSFGYRLAPEHPFPAALDDALAVWQWMLGQGISPGSVCFVGDSAGGGLVLGTLLALKDLGMTLPAGAVVYSPVTDFTCSGESHRTNLESCLSPKGMAQALAGHYSGEAGPEHPYVSPLYGNPEGLPPLLMFAGSGETLLDDSVMFARKAREAGVDVELEVGEGLFHCYPAMAPLFPEAVRAMDTICRFIREKTED